MQLTTPPVLNGAVQVKHLANWQQKNGENIPYDTNTFVSILGCSDLTFATAAGAESVTSGTTPCSSNAFRAIFLSLCRLSLSALVHARAEIEVAARVDHG